MANISDKIEKFIIATLGENESIEISRNSLAEYFACVPSQINYVLETRFTFDRGFIVESKRGGSGFIKITKIKLTDTNSYLNNLITNSVGEDLTEKRMKQILDKLFSEQIINFREKDLIEAVLSDDSLSIPLTVRDTIRANAFKNMLIKLMNKQETL